MSDQVITEECWLLPLLSEGDRVMADCGFDILATRNVTLNILATGLNSLLKT